MSHASLVNPGERRDQRAGWWSRLAKATGTAGLLTAPPEIWRTAPGVAPERRPASGPSTVRPHAPETRATTGPAITTHGNVTRSTQIPCPDPPRSRADIP